MLGGSMNPLIWREQLNRRVHPESLLSDTSTVESLNRDFEEKYSYVTSLKEKDFAYVDELIVEISDIYVQSKIDYRTDIRNYFSIDHFATPSEILKRGADDCDGRAILTTLLLRYRGYDAYVVLGFSHVWTEVQLDRKIISLNNPGYRMWYCKFNERDTQWNLFSFFILFTGFFLMFFFLFSALFYFHTKNIVGYLSIHLNFLRDYFYFVKYFIFLLLAFLVFGAIVAVITKFILP